MPVLDSAAALLTGISARLSAVSAVTALVGSRIYGAVPAKPTYPYVLITAQSIPMSANDFSAMEHTVRVQAFAAENKPGTCLAIRGAVMDALDRSESLITVQGGTLVSLEFDGLADAFPEDKGLTYQSVVEFKARVM